MEHRRWDDPIGAVPVHGACGIWGTLAAGLFATGQFGIPAAKGADVTTTAEGLFYGGGTAQLQSQLIGSLTCIVVVFAVAMVIMKFIASLMGDWALRITDTNASARKDAASTPQNSRIVRVFDRKLGRYEIMASASSSGPRV